MSKRFAGLFGLAGLVLAGLLVACGTTYNSSSDGLVLVGSQGSAVIETFSFSLASGSISAVSNSPTNTSNSTCLLPGIPSSMVLDPAGAYAYVILTANTACPGSKTGLAAFKVNSSGTTTSVGSLTADPTPVVLAMDPAGKFLFVAEGLNSYSGAPKPVSCPGTKQYGVCAYSIGSGGSLTAVQGTFNFTLPTGFQTPNFVALAPTPTILPANGVNGVQNSVCSDPGNNPPKSEFLYVVDSVNNVVWEFGVNTSTGVLTNPPNQSSVPYFTAGSVPSGVAVDPCVRFVYVSNLISNNISAYSICNGLPTQSSNCNSLPTWGLAPVAGSPFSLPSSGNGPGPLLVDPFGNYVYVMDTLSNQVSPFKISPVSGSLTAGTSVATGIQPTSMAIRGDDSWLFVTNFQTTTGLSQFSITPASGSLSPLPAVTTDNNAWGVAVK